MSTHSVIHSTHYYHVKNCGVFVSLSLSLPYLSPVEWEPHESRDHFLGIRTVPGTYLKNLANSFQELINIG